jgi:hypothetical protein
MSHRIITTIRNNSSSSPKWESIHFFSTTTESELCIPVVVILLHGILHNSVGCRLRKIATTLATTTTTTTRKRRGKTSQSRTTLHKQVGFSFLFFFYYYYNHFLSYVSFFRETLYMARPTKLIGVAAKPPAKKKTPRSVSCNARMYIQTGSNSWSPWTAKKRIDQKCYFVFFLTFSIVNMSGSNETKMHKPKTQMGTI